MTKLMNKKQEIKNRKDLINKGEVPEGYKRDHGYTVPINWQITRFNKLFDRITQKNNIKCDNVLTISAQYGLINQQEFFKKNIASKDTSTYFLLHKGDFAYNKSYSTGYPFGTIKRLKYYTQGIVSPLYICFKMKDNIANASYLEQYFDANKFNSEILAIAQEGARNHGLLNMGIDDFFNCRIINPPLQEQEKITEILSCCDKVIELKEKLLNEENKQKEWIRQNILTGKQRLKDFNKAWEKMALKNIFTEHKKTSIGIEEVHSVAVKKGIVNQLEHLGKCCAAEDTSSYNLVEPGDVVYTKSPTGKFPYGIIKQSKLTYNAIVSPLYGVFKPKTFELGTFLDEYFSSSVNTNNYLKPIIQKGAKNTINITNTTFLSNYVKIPTDIMEQKAIYNLININNKKISALEQELEQYKQLKKSLSQLLLTGIVRVNEV